MVRGVGEHERHADLYHGAGYGFSTPVTIAVRVRAAAHSGSSGLVSGTLARQVP